MTRYTMLVWLRRLHLYGGLVLGPFVIVFAVSAILLNHPSPAPAEAGAITTAPVRIPDGFEKPEVLDRVRAARDILSQLDLTGEVGFVALSPKQRTASFAVARPGWEANVRVELAPGQATVETHRRGLADAFHWLHKMPGQHLVAIRGNWLGTRVWRVLSDASVYLLLLITATGVYLWIVLRNSRPRSNLEVWLRWLHYYPGLFLLPLIWLFALSGLLLNHPKWEFASFWPQRKQERSQQQVQLAANASALEQAASVARQLALNGEIEFPAPRSRPGRFEFRIARPGRIANIDVDTSSGVASVERISVNGWGILKALHSFTGVRAGRPEATRQWWLTRLWSFSMDAVCAGIILMTLTGDWMWLRSALPARRSPRAGR